MAAMKVANGALAADFFHFGCQVLSRECAAPLLTLKWHVCNLQRCDLAVRYSAGGVCSCPAHAQVACLQPVLLRLKLHVCNLHRRDLAVRYSAGSVRLPCSRSSGMLATCIDVIWLSGTQQGVCGCPAHAHVGMPKWHVCNPTQM